ncbi:MAG TPA: diguanylate cyclase [Actinophytocola sp.]|uniref:diguanylate cyclase domain-containing protein n=1 Tax=Actinophytocola sp. TaxID=1872138 RepID=UPI002DBF49C2|nr:diguanylate cyclase [Actinophytocola sp.]HEU5470852.1 diguanylate cyclase [Actinophytocola sp.]
MRADRRIDVTSPGQPETAAGRHAEPEQVARELTSTWMNVVAASTYVAMTSRELEDYLHELVLMLAEALVAEPFDPRPGAEVGARMVTGALVGSDTLALSVRLLVEGLLDLGGPADRDRMRNLAALLSAMCTGYAEAVRRRTLDQQEDMKRALLSAKQRAEQVLRATETRFREVFTSSPTGIAITDLDGRFVDVNPALVEILGSQPDRLSGAGLSDYLAPDEAEDVTDPPRGRLKLVRDDGETAWVYVALSPLREGPGRPESYVLTVQDLSELQLLQGRFGHQLLHDALTGLANRLHFESAVETRLGRADPDLTVTLCCLNLDAFGALNNGLGHQAADRLLRTVAKRLVDVMAAENALVARTGGDEFAVLIEDSPTTPEIPELVDRINEALAEPEYVDGVGVAVNASVGVVRRPVAETSGAELFRAADAALHAARATGRRQWRGFDAERDARVQARYRDAAALPGAFEDGELGVGYRPVVRLDDRRTVAITAGLRWSGRPSGPLGERETMALAELTGQSVLCGPWMLRTACAHLPSWRSAMGMADAAALRVRLSRLQSADDDLVAAVLAAVEAAGVEPSLLEIGFDTGAVLEEFGSAADNLQVVAEIGVRTALCDWDGGLRQLDLLEHCPALSVVLGDPFAGRDDVGAALLRAAEASVGAAKGIGAVVSVDGIGTEQAAIRWAELGVDTAQGPLFGELTDVERALSGTGRPAQ